jgi:hypothetical protein
MQKRRKLLLATLVALLIVLGVILLTPQTPPRPKQPSYKGLELAQWLDIVARHRINGYVPGTTTQTRQTPKDATPEQIHEAEEAVRVIGTNALPFLLVWINPKPNALKKLYSAVLDFLPIPEPVRGFLWGLPGRKEETLAQFAVHGFRVLNTNALPAAADLLKLANDTNRPDTRMLEILNTVTNIHPQ